MEGHLQTGMDVWVDNNNNDCSSEYTVFLLVGVFLTDVYEHFNYVSTVPTNQGQLF